jgi:hypothetical protein
VCWNGFGKGETVEEGKQVEVNAKMEMDVFVLFWDGLQVGNEETGILGIVIFIFAADRHI